MKHTKGPFSTNGDRDSSTGTIRILAPEKETGWSSVLASISIKNTSPEEAEANAALFAAAPDLLEEVKTLIHILEKGTETPEDLEGAIEWAKELIIKAEGGAK